MFEYFDQETKEMNHLKYQIEHEINLLEKKIDIEEWSTNRVYKNDQNRRLIEFGKVEREFIMSLDSNRIKLVNLEKKLERYATDTFLRAGLLKSLKNDILDIDSLLAKGYEGWVK